MCVSICEWLLAVRIKTVRKKLRTLRSCAAAAPEDYAAKLGQLICPRVGPCTHVCVWVYSYVRVCVCVCVLAKKSQTIGQSIAPHWMRLTKRCVVTLSKFPQNNLYGQFVVKFFLRSYLQLCSKCQQSKDVWKIVWISKRLIKISLHEFFVVRSDL